MASTDGKGWACYVITANQCFSWGNICGKFWDVMEVSHNLSNSLRLLWFLWEYTLWFQVKTILKSMESALNSCLLVSLSTWNELLSISLVWKKIRSHEFLYFCSAYLGCTQLAYFFCIPWTSFIFWGVAKSSSFWFFLEEGSIKEIHLQSHL